MTEPAISMPPSAPSGRGFPDRGQSKGKRLRWRSLILWVCAGGLGFILLSLIGLWVNRYSVVEARIVNALAAQGYEADLTLTALHADRAQFRNVFISRDNRPVFAARDIGLEYAWRQLLAGELERVIITRAHVNAELGADGALIFPPLNTGRRATDRSEPLTMPKRGIAVKDSRLDVISPFGALRATVDGDYVTPESWQGTLDITPADFIYGDIAGQGGGRLSAYMTKGQPSVDLDMRFEQLKLADMTLTDMHLSGDIVPALGPDSVTLETRLTARIGGLQSPTLQIEAAEFAWAGQSDAPRDALLAGVTRGQWQLRAQALHCLARRLHRVLRRISQHR